jgi:hypothetical protein
VVEEGGDGKPPFKVEWVPPQVVTVAERHALEKSGALVLEFKAGKRTRKEPTRD